MNPRLRSMPKRVFLVVGLLCLSVGVAVLCAPELVIRLMIRALSRDTETARAKAPDGRYVAIGMDHDSGAAGSCSYIMIEQMPDIFGTKMQAVEELPFGGVNQLTWQDNHTLIVTGAIETQEKWRDVTVIFRPSL